MKRWLLSAAIVSMLAVNPSYAGTEEGVVALNAGDYQTALRELSYAARQGDAKAEYLYATMLKDGLGLDAPDVNASVVWYERAAEHGYPDAQLNLGFMLFHGMGKPKDKEAGVYWYEKAAKAGLAAAQYNLGKVLWDGEIGTKKPDEAQLWFYKSAKQGMAEAQFALGVSLLDGDEDNVPQAVSWFKRAAFQGEPRAYTKLAGLYTLGKGVSKDIVQAAKWAVLAEGAGDPMGKRLREKLNNEMTAQQISQAMAEAKAFRPRPER